MKNIDINGQTYEIIKDYKEAFNMDEFMNRWTTYFEEYDYILGDITYGKLRLKGFYDSKNKKASNVNDYKYIEKYIEKYCSRECAHFILKKG